MEIKELWQMAKELVGEEELTRRFRAWIGTLIRNARLKREKCDSTALEAQDTLIILTDLNERTKSRFQATDKATHLIVTLLKKGYSVEDFRKVHEVKCGQWQGNDKMEHCLRPSTLYAPSHFDEYLAEWWKQDRERKELQQKREQASVGRYQGTVNREQELQRAERDAKVGELMKRKWNEHASWLDFMRWTIQFPDADSLEAYPMPERVRKMRKAPGMMMQIATGKVAEWAELEYRELRNSSGVVGSESDPTKEAEHGKN